MPNKCPFGESNALLTNVLITGYLPTRYLPTRGASYSEPKTQLAIVVLWVLVIQCMVSTLSKCNCTPPQWKIR